MSSKMRAGLIAGGFFIAFTIAFILLLNFLLLNFLPSLAVSLIIFTGFAEFFGPPILAGFLAAAWLDVEEYGRQFAAGGFAGAIAALVLELGNLGLTAALLLVQQTNPADAPAQFVLSKLPLTGQVLAVVIVIVIRLILIFIYMMIALLIGGLTARIVGSGKGIQRLQQILEEQEAQMRRPAPPPLDPSLVPYQRPEYSPFASNQPAVLSPWQRRRLEREGKLPGEGVMPGGGGLPETRQSGPGSQREN
jgi:hypothetical protein